MKKFIYVSSIATIVLWFACFLFVNVIRKIEAGHSAALEFYGYVYPQSYASGPVTVIPGTRVISYDTREQVYAYDLSTKTGETQQNVKLEGKLNYAVNGDQVHILFQEIGEDYQNKLIIPKLEQALNEIVGKNSPELIVTEREMVREAVLYVMNDRMPEGLIKIKDLSVISPKFDPEVEKAIAEKAVAMQIAIKAKYDTQRVEEEAKQMRLRLEVEAQGLDMKSKALQNPLIVKYEYSKRWKGEVPSTIVVGQDTALPIIGLGK